MFPLTPDPSPSGRGAGGEGKGVIIPENFCFTTWLLTTMQPLLELPDQTLPNEIDEEILDIFVEEVNEVLEEMISSFTVWNTNPDNTEALKTLQRIFRTLKGDGRLVGAMVIGELGGKFENLLNQVIEGTIPTNNAILFLLDKVINLLPNMVEQFKNHQPTPYEVRLLISQVHHLTETKGQSMGEFAPPEEKTTALQVNLNPEPTIEFANQNQESQAEAPPEPELPEGEIQFGELFSPSEIEFLSQVDTPFEELLLPDDMQFEEIPSMPLIMEEDEDDQQVFIDNTQMAVESPPMQPKIVGESPETSPPPAEPVVPDATDEFMAVFLAEAEEILENTQSLLERWQASPHNLQLVKELQKELHTLRGGSRMVGISTMGDLSHSLESVLARMVEGGDQSNPKLQEIVQNSVDELATMLEAVRSGVPLDIPIELIASINKIMEEIIPTPAPPPAPTPAPTPAPIPAPAPTPELGYIDIITQVPDTLTDKIDKLTNLVRELSISRTHLEQQQGAVKNTLSEMEQAVARLRDRDPLRRLEIETEAQILSHYIQNIQILSKLGIDQKEFDPLELDRFSVTKQLSRSLLESIISDLLHIQEALKILTQPMDSLLLQQTRIVAELQDAVVRIRMIPFSRISPRLQRIARLSTKEQRKQVDFIINGEQIEFERTVLTRLAPPLEYMLRSAIRHGIEDAWTRQQAGKPAIAKMTLDISQEGNELILKLCDDGGEWDLPAIRKRVEEGGMIKPDTVISDDELMQFTLIPGFDRIGVLPWRDTNAVVCEIKQLGGTLHVHSKAGQGTSFEIRLPHSLTIN